MPASLLILKILMIYVVSKYDVLHMLIIEKKVLTMNNYEHCLMTKYTYTIYKILNFDHHRLRKNQQTK